MPVTIDFTQFYLYWIGTEEGTYVAKRSGGAVEYPIARALRRALTRREIDLSGGLFTSQDMAWNIAVDELPLPTDCQEGDQVRDGDGITWIVAEVQLLTKRSRWRLVCKRERL